MAVTEHCVSEVIIRVMKENDVEEATRLLADAFTGREPLTVCLGIKAKDDLSYAQRICERAAQDGVSMVAQDTMRKKIVGVATTFAMRNQEDDDVIKPLRIFRPIHALLNRLVRCFTKHPDYANVPLSKIAQFIRLAVHPDYTGRGIATMLREANARLANSKGFRMAIATATAPATHKMYAKLGFVELHEIRYEDFEFEGRRPFEGVTECKSAKLFIKSL
ncbi:uncharacterized protein [Ptychodera flava]|uniref:uncharacterized protein n=1 Tax=Ptychodera flava TaxID=63121 RepID=UPI00396A2C59